MKDFEELRGHLDFDVQGGHPTGEMDDSIEELDEKSEK